MEDEKKLKRRSSGIVKSFNILYFPKINPPGFPGCQRIHDVQVDIDAHDGCYACDMLMSLMVTMCVMCVVTLMRVMFLMFKIPVMYVMPMMSLMFCDVHKYLIDDFAFCP